MNHDPEIEFHLREMFGPRDSDERSCAESIQKSTDAIDAFFERLDVEGYPGHNSKEANRDQPALDDLRSFVKAEKQRVPTMTSREMRGSVVNLLRKTADAMAAE
jgi:hypothetical protein